MEQGDGQSPGETRGGRRLAGSTAAGEKLARWMKPGVAEPEDGPVVPRKLSPKFSHEFATIGSLDLQL